MDNLGGITAEFGFVYQRLVFIHEIIENCVNPDDSVSYEAVDDVGSVTRDYKDFRSIRMKKRIIQCKTGELTEYLFDKVIMNGKSNYGKYLMDVAEGKMRK